jgi:hypothetical protein
MSRSYTFSPPKRLCGVLWNIFSFNFIRVRDEAPNLGPKLGQCAAWSGLSHTSWMVTDEYGAMVE